MAELAVVDEEERDRIRASLKQYKATHGNIGDTKLFDRMYYVLDPQHLVYLSQSTMQRFIRGKGRTSDEAVWAIKKFLERVQPSGSSAKLPEALVKELLVPVKTEPSVFEPAGFYQGRYDLYIQPSSGEFFGTKFGQAHNIHYVLVPSADPRYLRVWSNNTQAQTTNYIPQYFMRCGAFQFLLITAGSDASFTLLAHIDDDPLTLQGTMLQTASTWPPSTPPFEFKLVRIQGPDLKKKSHTGQYGKKPN